MGYKYKCNKCQHPASVTYESNKVVKEKKRKKKVSSRRSDTNPARGRAFLVLGLEPAVATTSTSVTAAISAAAAAISTAVTAVSTTAIASLATSVRVRAAPVVVARLSDIATTGLVTTTTATTTTARSSSSSIRTLSGEGLEPGGNVLVGLLQELEQVTDDALVAAVQESSGNTSVTSTTGTTDSVNVIIDIRGQVIRDDVGDVGDIQTTSSNSSCNHDGAATGTEHVQGTLTLALSAVSVNRGGGEVLAEQEIREGIGHALGLDENQGQAQIALRLGMENVEKNGALVLVLDVLDSLGNVLGGRTDTTDRQEDVVAQEVASKVLDVAREGGREHEGVTLVDSGHILLLDQTSDLGLETHVQHTIGLVEDKVLNVGKRDTAALNQIDQTTGGSSQHVTSTVNGAELLTNIGSSIDDAGTDPGAVRKLAGLLPDLRGQLTGGCENQGRGVGLAGAASTSLLGEGSRSTLEKLRKNREEETTSLSRTSLGTSHQITIVADNRDGVLLDGGRLSVLGELNVLEEEGIQRRAGEGQDGFGDIVTGSLNGDIVVLLKVNTGALALLVFSAVELALETGVAGSRDLDTVLEGSNITIQAGVARRRSVATATAISAGRGTVVPATRGLGMSGLVPAAVVSALRGTTPTSGGARVALTRRSIPAE